MTAGKATQPEFKELIAGVRSGQRRALARLITRIDNGEFIDDVRTMRGKHDPTRSLVVGLTGSPGAGKSSLTAALVAYLRENGKTVAVLASDPASPFTGGALLGDRVRIDYDPNDAGVFVRSFSSRGAAGGLSESTPDVVRIVEEFGFQVILIETVGSGQDQLAVRDMVDVLTLVLTPAGGDDIQWEKAGQMEAADVVALNKSDLPGADFALAGLRSMLELSPTPAPPIVKTVATTREGVTELWQAIETLASTGSEHPHFAANRRVLAAAQRELRRLFERAVAHDEATREIIDAFQNGSCDENNAGLRLLERIVEWQRSHRR